MHILLCKYYSKDESRNATKQLRKIVFRFETMDPERHEGRGQGYYRGEGVGSRERNEGRRQVGGGEGVWRGRRGRGEGERGR